MADGFPDDDQEKFHFRWQIKNFSFSPQQPGEAIESPTFPVDCLDNTTWQLLVYPRGKREEEYVAIYLKRVEDDSIDKKVDLIFFMELEAADSTRVQRRKPSQTPFGKNNSKGFKRCIERRVLFGAKREMWLPNDTLTLHCTFQKPVQKSEHIYELSADTTQESITSEFTWTLKNWSKSDSVMFFKDVEFVGRWCEPSLRIIICDSGEFDKNLVLKMAMLKPKKEAFVICIIAVLDTEGGQVLHRSTGHYFKDGTETTSYDLYNREEIEEAYLQDGNLRLQCFVYMYTGKKPYKAPTFKYLEVQKEEDLEDHCNKELVKDYENLYLNGTLSNIKIRADGRIVHTHKALLRARSQVFRDLLDGAEQNLVDDIIDVDNLDGDTLERLIYFLYSDKVKDINSATALKLLEAGYKYQLGNLKEQCSHYLKTHFSLGNVCDVLIVAHRFEEPDLKRNAIRYISEYFSRICLTPAWHNFRTREKELASYTCQCIRRMKNL